MFSAVFVPLHAGSWLISIFCGFGAVPLNFTVPFTVATVFGSMAVPAAFVSAPELSCSSLVFSFLLQPASRTVPRNAIRPSIAIQALLFMMSHLSVKYSWANKTLHSTANALMTQPPRQCCWIEVLMLECGAFP